MQAAVQSRPQSPVEAEVLRIRDLVERKDFGVALRAAEVLAAQFPENRDILYLMAVSHRYLRNIPAALTVLERLEALHPGFSRLYQERGHCHRDLRQDEAAIAAYRRAVGLNAALPGSWRARR